MESELKTPPNVPEWMRDFGLIFDGLLTTEEFDKRRLYLRAAVYAQLWRDEDDRIGSKVCEESEIDAACEEISHAEVQAIDWAAKMRSLAK